MFVLTDKREAVRLSRIESVRVTRHRQGWAVSAVLPTRTVTISQHDTEEAAQDAFRQLLDTCVESAL